MQLFCFFILLFFSFNGSGLCPTPKEFSNSEPSPEFTYFEQTEANGPLFPVKLEATPLSPIAIACAAVLGGMGLVKLDSFISRATALIAGGVALAAYLRNRRFYIENEKGERTTIHLRGSRKKKFKEALLKIKKDTARYLKPVGMIFSRREKIIIDISIIYEDPDMNYIYTSIDTAIF